MATRVDIVSSTSNKVQQDLREIQVEEQVQGTDERVGCSMGIMA